MCDPSLNGRTFRKPSQTTEVGSEAALTGHSPKHPLEFGEPSQTKEGFAASPRGPLKWVDFPQTFPDNMEPVRGLSHDSPRGPLKWAEFRPALPDNGSRPPRLSHFDQGVPNNMLGQSGTARETSPSLSGRKFGQPSQTMRLSKVFLTGQNDKDPLLRFRRALPDNGASGGNGRAARVEFTERRRLSRKQQSR